MKKTRLLIVAFALLAAFAISCGEESDNANGESAADANCNTETVTTDSGLEYRDIECGDGEEVESGDTISVNYTGTLEDGTEFDSSEGTPVDFPIGVGQVIPGWDEGIPGMRVGGIRELVIPPELGYGESGFPPAIPPNSTLVFEVEIVDVTKAP